MWVHSFEEDKEGLKIFRIQSDYEFPLSRKPRERFEIKPNGEFIEYIPGPSDNYLPKLGRYKVEDPSTIKVNLGNESYTLNVMSLEQNILKVKK